jgi:hypothetical protein
MSTIFIARCMRKRLSTDGVVSKVAFAAARSFGSQPHRHDC